MEVFMNINLRTGRPDDAKKCGLICYEAFKTISQQHNFPPDLPNPELGVELVSYLLSRNDIYSVVAEVDGKVVGSNFLWENAIIAGIGPITIDPAGQDASIGRMLMQDVLDRVHEKRFAGVRLVQAAYHNRSLSLYTKLGFDTREPLSLIHGQPIGMKIQGYNVRQATEGDLTACSALSLKVHGFDRGPELLDAIKQGTAKVVEQSGQITGYATLIGFFGHAVTESNRDLQALIAAAESFPGLGFLLPTRNGDLLRWCFEKGLRIVQPMTLMSKGLYNEPKGSFLPSIVY
jgi:predicted N-acetyltransferase YhbS